MKFNFDLQNHSFIQILLTMGALTEKIFKTNQLAIGTGLLLGISLSLGTQILTWLGYGLTNMFVILTYLLVILFIVYAQRRKWYEKGDKLSFFSALLTVIIIVIISRYIFQFYMYMYTRYVDPEWVNTVSTYWTQMMRDSGTPEENISRSISNFKRSYLPIQMFTTQILKFGFSQIVVGILASIYFIIKKPLKINNDVS